MDRCYREKAANYPRYGGRGISVCDEWHYIDVFGRWAEANGFEPGLTLDRIDPNGNYEPSNCRWVTRKQQANNRTNTVYVTIDGVTKTLSEWADFCGISRSTMSDRYFCKGWRGVTLLHRVEDTRFKNGYNKYADPKHYHDATTIIPADGYVKQDNHRAEIAPEANSDRRSCGNCRYREMRVSLQEKAEPYCGLFLRWIENLRVCNCWMGKEKNDG